jgi:hypothetical protein
MANVLSFKDLQKVNRDFEKPVIDSTNAGISPFNTFRLEVLEFDAGNVRLKSSGALLSETSTSFNRGWVKIEFKK